MTDVVVKYRFTDESSEPRLLRQRFETDPAPADELRSVLERDSGRMCARVRVWAEAFGGWMGIEPGVELGKLPRVESNGSGAHVLSVLVEPAPAHAPAALARDANPPSPPVLSAQASVASNDALAWAVLRLEHRLSQSALPTGPPPPLPQTSAISLDSRRTARVSTDLVRAASVASGVPHPLVHRPHSSGDKSPEMEIDALAYDDDRLALPFGSGASDDGSSHVHSSMGQYGVQQRLDLAVLSANPLVCIRDGSYHALDQGGALDFKGELALLRSSLSRTGKRVCARVDVASTGSLSEVIVQSPRCLYLVCHADYDAPDSGSGPRSLHLSLEDTSGVCDRVSIERLDALLRDETDRNQDGSAGALPSAASTGGLASVGVVVLGACHSLDAGEAFVKAGCRHVVAIKPEAKVLDDDAALFARTFLFALFQGQSVRAAFVRGKGAVASAASPRMQQRHGDGRAVESAKFVLLPEGAPHDERPMLTLPPGELSEVNPLPALEPPTVPTPFVGRCLELQALVRMLRRRRHAEVRLLTLWGERGVGKTALAKAAAQFLYSRRLLHDGVAFVELSGVRTEAATLAALGDALDMEVARWKDVSRALQRWQGLIVLDGPDALLAHAHTAVERLMTTLMQAAHVQVVAAACSPISEVIGASCTAVEHPVKVESLSLRDSARLVHALVADALPPTMRGLSKLQTLAAHPLFDALKGIPRRIVRIAPLIRQGRSLNELAESVATHLRHAEQPPPGVPAGVAAEAGRATAGGAAGAGGAGAAGATGAGAPAAASAAPPPAESPQLGNGAANGAVSGGNGVGGPPKPADAQPPSITVSLTSSSSLGTEDAPTVEHGDAGAPAAAPPPGTAAARPTSGSLAKSGAGGTPTAAAAAAPGGLRRASVPTLDLDRSMSGSPPRHSPTHTHRPSKLSGSQDARAPGFRRAQPPGTTAGVGEARALGAEPSADPAEEAAREKVLASALGFFYVEPLAARTDVRRGALPPAGSADPDAADASAEVCALGTVTAQSAWRTVWTAARGALVRAAQAHAVFLAPATAPVLRAAMERPHPLLWLLPPPVGCADTGELPIEQGGTGELGWVGGADVAGWLPAGKALRPRLVVLWVAGSAELAAALAAQGVTAAVGLRAPVSNGASARFAATLLRELCAGAPIGAAFACASGALPPRSASAIVLELCPSELRAGEATLRDAPAAPGPLCDALPLRAPTNMKLSAQFASCECAGADEAGAAEPGAGARAEETLVGRALAVHAVVRASMQHSLTAVYGAPGVGKSAVVHAAARYVHVRGLFPGGVFTVDLGARRTMKEVLGAIASALGVEHASKPSELGLALPSTQRTLLVLDRCELAVQTAAKPFCWFLHTLLAKSSATVLVTSQVPLPADADEVIGADASVGEVEVGPMAPEESAALLARALRTEGRPLSKDMLGLTSLAAAPAAEATANGCDTNSDAEEEEAVRLIRALAERDGLKRFNGHPAAVLAAARALSAEPELELDSALALVAADLQRPPPPMSRSIGSIPADMTQLSAGKMGSRKSSQLQMLKSSSSAASALGKLKHVPAVPKRRRPAAVSVPGSSGAPQPLAPTREQPLAPTRELSAGSGASPSTSTTNTPVLGPSRNSSEKALPMQKVTLPPAVSSSAPPGMPIRRTGSRDEVGGPQPPPFVGLGLVRQPSLTRQRSNPLPPTRESSQSVGESTSPSMADLREMHEGSAPHTRPTSRQLSDAALRTPQEASGAPRGALRRAAAKSDVDIKAATTQSSHAGSDAGGSSSALGVGRRARAGSATPRDSLEAGFVREQLLPRLAELSDMCRAALGDTRAHSPAHAAELQALAAQVRALRWFTVALAGTTLAAVGLALAMAGKHGGGSAASGGRR